MIFKNAVVFTDNGFNAVDFMVNGDTIVDIKQTIASEADDTIDLNNMLVIPGLVDIHTHGINGLDFSNANNEQIKAMANFYIKKGTTSLLPTLVTLNKEQYKKQIKYLSNNISTNGPYLGINLEGPFISKQKKGSHNESSISDISIDYANELWRLSNSSIKLMTVAPELEHFMDLLSFSRDKFKLSLGHTACDKKAAEIAIKNGVNHITHLFNAMEPLHHRSPSLVGCSLEHPVEKELICDGLHVDDSLLKGLFRGYSDEIIMISDSIAGCGLTKGTFKLGDLDVYIKDNKLLLNDGTLAGSKCTLLESVKHLIDIGVDIKKAIKSATIIPAKAISMDNQIGKLEVGYKADFIVCDREFELVRVYKNGVERISELEDCIL